MKPYSEIISADGSIKIDITKLKDIYLLVKTSRGMQRVHFERTSKRCNRLYNKQRKKLISTTALRNTYNDKLIVPQVKYVLSYIDEKKQMQTVFIKNSGIMSSALFGYNGLPDELIKNENALRDHFEAEFSTRDMLYSLERIDNFFEANETVEESSEGSIAE